MPSVDLRQTAAAIAKVQTADGAIPWEPGRHVDPWNHVEAAMGLDAMGFHAEAERAYGWLSTTQRRDGSWPSAVLNGATFDATLDANFCAYVSVGAWHHFLTVSDDRWLRSMWDVVAGAMDFVLELQSVSGAVLWARDADHQPASSALLTSCSCIHLSLWCAVTIADRLGEARPDWELSLAELGAAVVRGRDFEPKEHFAMDWYYPVLGGAIGGPAAMERLREGWDGFVVDGKGVLCTSDKPWVTTGETSELILACLASNLDEPAADLFGWVQHLRDDDGLYWTGANHPGGDVWPREKTTWSAASVILAGDALMGGPTASLFSGASLIERPTFVDPVSDSL